MAYNSRQVGGMLRTRRQVSLVFVQGRATMRASLIRLSAAALGVLVGAALVPPTPAQPAAQPNTAAANSPLFQVNPYLFNQGQNLSYQGRVYSQMPPNLAGANPYAGAVGNPYLGGYGGPT